MLKTMAFSIENCNTDNYESEEDVDAYNFETYDDFTDNELELLGLFVPLRSMSEITGLDGDTLRQLLLISQILPDRSIYAKIKKYIENGDCHSFNLSLERIFKIRRFEGNNLNYDKCNRMLLWHGTNQGNLASILQFGFLLPEHKPKRQMFGCGLYFADRASKSVQYCGSSKLPGSKAYLLLCDINLGNMHSVTEAYNHLQAPPDGFDSVKGLGKKIPDENESVFYHGSIMPIGKTINNAQNEDSMLNYNEYIIYDANRIIFKFLVEVQFA